MAGKCTVEIGCNGLGGWAIERFMLWLDKGGGGGGKLCEFVAGALQ